MAWQYTRQAVMVVTLAVFSGLGLGFAKDVVAAEEAIPPKMLSNVYDGCLVKAEQTIGSYAKAYCSCNVNELKNAFSLREFIKLDADMREATNNGTNPMALTTPSVKKLNEISVACERKAIEE